MTMLDVTSLVLTGVEGIHPGQARLTFAMARHAAVDLAQVVNARYDPLAPERMTDADFNRVRDTLAEAGLKLRGGEAAQQKLAKLRSMYEPYIHSTAKNLMVALPPWQHPVKVRDNWQAGPWDRIIQARGLAVLGQKPVAPCLPEPRTISRSPASGTWLRASAFGLQRSISADVGVARALLPVTCWQLMRS